MEQGQKLLDIARDYFYFVTKFFEVIKLSAPHIYHSALELSPHSAIVRKLYYHHRPHPMPRVVRGVPKLWNQPLTIKTNHQFSTWSPCGKFLAVATPNNVEIWDTLTLERHSTLWSTGPSRKLQDIPACSPDGITYSPDGRSLACYSSSSTAIIIWDIQTGGVVDGIECGAVGTTLESLVWSHDGKTIGAIFACGQDWAVCVCDVALGTMVVPGILQSSHKPYLWPHNKSLRVLAILDHKHIDFNIYEVGPTLIRIRLFAITHDFPNDPKIISFSPTTHHVSIVTKHTLLVVNHHDQVVLSQKIDNFYGNYFSPDGNLLVASRKDFVHIWQHGYNQYSLWKKIPLRGGPGDLPQSFRFSPTSASVLISGEGFLEVVHLDDHEANPPKKSLCQYGKISTNGTYIVTADQDGGTVTITTLHSQISSQLIDTSFKIHGLALTGNVLLVEGEMVEGEITIVAWRLTAEGAVEGILGNKVADLRQGIWRCRWPRHGAVESLVMSGTGAIRIPGKCFLCYNTNTGECYKSVPIQVPSHSSSWHNLTDDRNFHTLLHYHSFHERNDPLEDDQPASIPGYKEGWVKYPEGEHPHRFWLPAHWMVDCRDNAYWLNDITTLWLHGNELLVIKF
jgi:hypothetical protein